MNWIGLIRGYFSQKRSLLLCLFLAIVAAAVLEIIFPWLVQEAVDSAVGDKSAIQFQTAIVGMGLVAVGAALLHGIGIWIDSRLFSAASADLRFKLASGFLHRPLRYIQERHSSELIHRVSTSVTSLEQLMIELFSEMPFSMLVAFGIVVMMIRIDLGMTLLVLSQMGIATYITHRISYRLPAMQRLLQLLGARLAGQLQESLTAIRVIKAFGAEEGQLARFQICNDRLTETTRVAGTLRAVVVPVWGMIEVLSVVIVLWYGGSLLGAGKISIGKLVAFITYVEMLSVPIHRFGDYYFLFQACRGTAQRLAGALTKDRSHVEDRGGVVDADEWSIDVDNVTFSYDPSLPPVLHELSFQIASGESVAIAGRNGAGKSTLLDLLLRFHQPQEGQIRIGSTNLSDWDAIAWRRSIGFVPQDAQLISGTLAENLCLGINVTSEEEMESALGKVAGCDWRERFPLGLDTFVGESGIGMSGGQRQLIAMARVYLRNPKVVILDEPTAHLDGEALELVNSAIAELMEARTVILVSHRPETIQLMSRVLLLENGHIVDTGSPQDPSLFSSTYSQLLNSHP